MDYDLVPEIEDLNNGTPQPHLTIAAMNHHLITDSNNPSLIQPPQQPFLWNASGDMNTIEELLGVRHSTNAPSTNTPQANNNNNNNNNNNHQMYSNHLNPVAPILCNPNLSTQIEQQHSLSLNNNNMSDVRSPESHPMSSVTAPPMNRKRKISEIEQQQQQQHSQQQYQQQYQEKKEPEEQVNTLKLGPTQAISSSSSSTTNSALSRQQPSNPGCAAAGSSYNAAPVIPSLSEPLVIDENMLVQLGGIPYAELCKERAREAFKEAKKNEHLANGNFDRMKRRKKGDNTMTAKEKYRRRLQMNQDSAAAARHAQEVYVDVLERLVTTSEAEKKSFLAEVCQIRSHSDRMTAKAGQLNENVVKLQKCLLLEQQRNANSNNNNNNSSNKDNGRQFAYDGDGEKKQDPGLAKFLDLFKGSTSIGAQPDMGVQPARAV